MNYVRTKLPVKKHFVSDILRRQIRTEKVGLQGQGILAIGSMQSGTYYRREIICNQVLEQTNKNAELFYILQSKNW